MISINMKRLWADDIEQLVEGIKEATLNTQNYNDIKKLSELISDWETVISCWTGKTYIGAAKDIDLANAYHIFFSAMMEKLILFKNSKHIRERDVANRFLYQGTVYRYLGYDCDTYHQLSKPQEFIQPIFDNIYVAWSQNKENNEVEKELYGPKTHLTCEIKGTQYGIQLSKAGLSKTNEYEVVFPTIKNCITEIKYIGDEDDE